MDRRLCVHHVGGRNGYGGFPVFHQFEPDLVRVVYDADPNCIDQIKQLNEGISSELHVLPYGLSNYCGTGTLNVNYDPYTSSLLEANPTYSSHYSSGSTDYIYGDGCKTVEQVSVELLTLDALCKVEQPIAPPPDFISIDTQGSEYEILQGSDKSLDENILAVIVEVEFIPLYKNQKLFGDLVELLSRKGFDFVRFVLLGATYAFRYPIGLRGERFQSSGDGLFFRRIEDLMACEPGLNRSLKLAKLALLAILFEHYDYGLQCLQRLSPDELSQLIDNQSEPKVRYLEFLRDFFLAAQRVPQVYPATFKQLITFDESKSRFNADSHPFENQAWQKVTAGQKTSTHPSLSDVAMSFDQHFSEIEALLIRWGLKSHAERLRSSRLGSADEILPRPWKRKIISKIKKSINHTLGIIKNFLSFR